MLSWSMCLLCMAPEKLSSEVCSLQGSCGCPRLLAPDICQVSTGCFIAKKRLAAESKNKEPLTEKVSAKLRLQEE